MDKALFENLSAKIEADVKQYRRDLADAKWPTGFGERHLELLKRMDADIDQMRRERRDAKSEIR